MDQAGAYGDGRLTDLQLQSDRRLAMAALTLLTIPSVWFVRTDLALFWGDWSTLSARFLVRAWLILIPLVSIFTLRSVRTRAAYSRCVLLTSLAVAVGYVALNALRPAGSGMPLRTPLFALAMMYAALPNSLPRQAAAPLLLSVGLAAIGASRLRTPDGDLIGDLVVLAVFNALGLLVAARRLHLESDVQVAWQDRQEARTKADTVMSELRSLERIIPICSHCKRVRTEIGDWQQIEEYMRRRNDTDFSHGICPNCMREQYSSAIRT